MVERNGTTAKADEGESQCGGRERELDSAVAGESVVPMHLPYGHTEIDADGESSTTSEKPSQNEQSSKKLGHHRDISQTSGKAHAANHVHKIVHVFEDFLITVRDHNDAKDQAHDEKSERLQAIEVAQSVLRKCGREEIRKLDYRRQRIYVVATRINGAESGARWKKLITE
jgi:hypothetical protein